MPFRLWTLVLVTAPNTLTRATDASQGATVTKNWERSLSMVAQEYLQLGKGASKSPPLTRIITKLQIKKFCPEMNF